jgi:carbonic anhydrase/acetyltransferase-like protein (isoleucine patch superfamily)
LAVAGGVALGVSRCDRTRATAAAGTLVGGVLAGLLAVSRLDDRDASPGRVDPQAVTSAAMPLFALDGVAPTVHPDAFIAPTATLVGDVTVEAGASIWYGAVLRADYSPVVVRAGANVQDGSVLHGPPDMPVEIGPGATVAHLCVVHGAILGEECLIANATTVLDGARIGARSLVAAHSLVAAGAEIPDGVLAAGSPAVVKRPIAGTPAEFWVTMNPPAYAELARRHKAGVTPVN